MNDLSYTNSLSDAALLQQVGEFIKTRRVAQNLSQDEVAERAAISRSTLSLLERGENIALRNLLKILRVLDALYVLEQFKVVNQISPMLLAKEDEKKRKRAYRTNTQRDKDDWEW
ncbi:helix-turn-helix transcriptional regulator [Sphingobacterium sp. lm-10]|uniref:helix-turn-helix domain-containing protein n=1 Tax=Sphingobacterium sp. lm-10 TaxID=2944904 RepID=UPI0020223029|nr:helix-turn-helix transcriptional regulator [Sphingobacterium sp. lm-10]MCL7986436.1 helix-turn-helix transcriptional regulator [Sphingobacterium sp. lm-10]